MKKIEISRKPVSLGPLSVLGTLMGLVQLAGVIAICGFMYVYGRETFLGVRSSHAASDLGIAMGEFSLGSFLLLLHSGYNAVFLGALLFVVIGLYVAKYHLKPRVVRNETASKFRYLALLASTGLAFAIVALFELPVANINDALLTNITEQCGYDHPLVGRLSCQYWKNLLLAHPADISAEANLKKDSAQKDLENFYALSVFSAMLAWFLLFYDRADTDRINRSLQTLALTMCVCCTLLLPYTFGKLFGWDWTPDITVLAKTEKGIEWKSGLLLDSSDRSIFVITMTNAVTNLHEFPRASILQSYTGSNRDVLTEKMKSDAKKPTAP